jgi:hypothetical protein
MSRHHNPAITNEQRIWNAYALAGIFPRRIPEWIDDKIIGEKLRECERTEVLPWEWFTHEWNANRGW